MGRNLLACLVTLALATAGTAWAGNTGKIAGEVKDAQTGEALIGINVLIEGTTQGAATNLDGYYVILNISPGKYTLSASGVGYNKRTVQNVSVSIDLTTTIDFDLTSTVVDVGEEITVTAQRPLVQRDLTAKTAVVSTEQIAALPVTEVGQVLSLQAGFTGAGNLRGGRSGEVAYWIDGVPVTDAYNGTQVVEVNKNLVQELQLVSGAFNAEYGQALSGIVNIATKEGGQRFAGGVSVYGGGYLTNAKYSGNDSLDLYPGLDFRPTAIRNFEANLSGPVIGDDLTFFINGRYIYFDGWLKGQRRFNPWNISYTDEVTRQFTLFRDEAGKGDNEWVPMNSSERWYGQGKLTWRIAPTVKLNSNYIYDRVKRRPLDSFNNDFRRYFYNPDGMRTDYDFSNTVILQLTHTLSASTFYTLGASFFEKNYERYLYDLEYAADIDTLTGQIRSQDLIEKVVPGTDRYVHPRLLQTDDLYSLYTGGNDNTRFKRRTITKLLKGDISSQIDAQNLVKLGVEFRRHSLFLEDITLQPILAQTDINLATADPFIQTRILPVSSYYHDVYNHTPTEFSAYIQDKLEFKDFVLNIGLRFDYFDPDGVVLADPSDPEIYNPIKPENRFYDENGNGRQDAGERTKTVEERRAYWYKKASSKTQWSPRIGASFPITAQGVVHFSYGHFFQIPRFERLYENPDFKLGTDLNSPKVMGNADLKPEQTISGEIGIKQAITEDISVDLTAYLRDTRDLAGTRADQISVFGGSTQYSKYVNSDFGLIKGIVLTVDKRFSSGFAATLDYTYQIAKGTASDPQEARNAALAQSLPEVQLIPLGWDQRNTLNITASYNSSGWGVSLIGQYHSGGPYTPRRSTDITTLLTNSQNKPSYFNLDLRAFYEFPLDPFRFVLFARAFNVLDIQNENDVYDDTGRSGFTTDEARALAVNPRQRVNTLDEWFRRPVNYSEPRRLEFGLNVEF